MSVYLQILKKLKAGKKIFAVLIDPQDMGLNDIETLVQIANDAHVDLFLIGGSLMHNNSLKESIAKIKHSSSIPCIVFPSNILHIEPDADALLLLSLISGRNPEYLIGRHVEASVQLKNSGLELIPTGYVLIDSGKLTSVHYMSQSLPIPRAKTDIAVSTALAGELLGLKLIYLEGGSGAQDSVPLEMIHEVKKNISVPLMVGGGIKSPKQAHEIMKAGADIVVIGNAFEQNAQLIYDMSLAIHSNSQIIDR